MGIKGGVMLGTIIDWVKTYKSKEHEQLKKILEKAKTQLAYLKITNTPEYLLIKQRKLIKRLEHRLNQGRWIK